MGFIRVIHQSYYDPDRGRFTSLAFRHSSDGSGISTFEEECSLRVSGSICEHIAGFYHAISSTPAIFWIIEPQLLPDTCHYQSQPISDGDPCHYGILGLTHKEEKAIFGQARLSDFRICVGNGEHRALDKSDLEP